MTRARTRGIGQVPDGLDRLAPGLDEFLQAARKILLDAQLGRLSASSLTSGATAGGDAGSGDEVDPTTPPTPSGVDVVAGINFVGITTDPPTFTAGHGYGRTLVYGAKWTSGPLPTFSAAVKVHEFVGDVGAFPSDPATQWHIWVIWRSRDGYNSGPEGGLNGHQVTTGQDVTLLLEALTGAITETQLYAALGARIDLIDAPDTTPGSVNARVLAEATTRQSADSALASDITALEASVATDVSTLTAAVATEASARASVDGHLAALYTVRVQLTEDGRTISGGFGLSGTSGGDAGPTIDFGVRADTFWVGAPAGATGVSDVLPFIVRTSDTVENGVVIPKGVYMDAAYVVNLTAMFARFGTAVITDAMIVELNASKIRAGSIGVGEYIQSSSFTPGGTGFRIDGGGGVEIRNSGATRVFNLNASGTEPVIKVGTAFEILANGSAAYAGALSAATGSFAGDISAATGTFSGSLSVGPGSGARTNIVAGSGISYITVHDSSNVLRLQLGVWT